MPGYVWSVAESVLEPSESNCDLINEVLIIHAGFIGHAPTCVEELKLSVGDKSLHLLFLSICSLVPPSVEKGHFNDRKCIFSILAEFAHNSVNSVLHSCELSLHVSSVEVVIDCLEPSHIIVRVRNEMDGQQLSITLIRFIVMSLKHFLVMPSECSIYICEEQSEHEKKSKIFHCH